MPCNLPVPQWVNPARAGLQASQQVPAQSSTALSWGQALPTLSDAEVFYNIYYSNDVFALFDTPRLYSQSLSTLVPNSLAPDGYYFGVRSSQLGVTGDFGMANLLSASLNADSYLYPGATTVTSPVDTTGVVVSVPVVSTSLFPLADGYLLIGTDILHYSAISGSIFTIDDDDPFGCNDGYAHSAGTAIELYRGFEDGNTAGFIPVKTCIVAEPDWVFDPRPGLQSATDLGIGRAIRLSWSPGATVPSGVSGIYYNVYWGTSSESIFSAPMAITQKEEVIVPLLTPGQPYYFAVRATYFTNDWDITDLTRLSPDLYAYPVDGYVLEQNGEYSESELTPLEVNSTVGFPDASFLLVGSEVLSYGSKQSLTAFNISARDVFDFGQTQDHVNGTVIGLYKGIEDFNETIFKAVPSWDGRGTSPGPLTVDVSTFDGYDGYGYLQDADGYRAVPGEGGDNLTENHEDFEEENEGYNAQPFCGYRSQNFVDLYNQNTCGTYFGGQFGGTGSQGETINSDGTIIPGPIGGGININEINLQREELLLGLTGEPFMLLRRKWEGRVSGSMTHRHEHPGSRYPGDYGTQFDEGFDQYRHLRQLRPGVANPNGLIMLRVEPYENDLALMPELGLHQTDKLKVWGSAIPPLKDRDVLVRYIVDNNFNIIEEEFRYVIEMVNRNRILFGRDGRQQASIKKLDKTHEVYKFSVTLV